MVCTSVTVSPPVLTVRGVCMYVLETVGAGVASNAKISDGNVESFVSYVSTSLEGPPRSDQAHSIGKHRSCLHIYADKSRHAIR